MVMVVSFPARVQTVDGVDVRAAEDSIVNVPVWVTVVVQIANIVSRRVALWTHGAIVVQQDRG